MATATIGTTSTAYQPYSLDAGYIMSSFIPSWGGNVDPGRGRAYYQVTNQEVYVRNNDTGTAPNVYVVAGSSFGDYSKANQYAGTTNNSFAYKSATVSYILGDGIRYYAGCRTTSNGGIKSTRSTGATGYTVDVNGTQFSSSQQYIKFTFYGLPSAVRSLAVLNYDASTIYINWSPPSDNGGSSITQYVVQRSLDGSNWSDLATTPNQWYIDSGLNDLTTYYYRVSAENGLQTINSFTPSLRGPYSNTVSQQTPSAVQPPVVTNYFGSGTVNVSYTGYAFATNTPTSWSLSGTVPPGTTHYASGDYYYVTGTPTTAGTYSFTVTATNAGGSDSASASVVIDPPPNPTWNSTFFPDGKVNQAYSQSITAANSTSVSGSGAPPGMSFTSVNASTLRLSGTPTASGTYNMTVTANGQTGTTAAVAFPSIYIAPLTPPVWTDDQIVNTFVVGTAYSDSVSATNSPTYTVSAGQLPSGISLSSSTGALTGTPTTKQAYSFTIRAANNDGNVTVAYSGTTSAPPVFTDNTLADFEHERAYSDKVTATSLTTPGTTYAVTAGALPTGIALSSSTGNVTGTPTTVQPYSFEITATNPDGSASVTFVGNVLAVPNWTDNQLTAFIENVAYADAVVATNSPTYAVTAGSLPTGTSLDGATGIVSGTPTILNEAYSFTITASTADGTISQAFSGTVQPDLGGGVKVYDNGAWANKYLYVYDGAVWQPGKVYVYNGIAWVKSVY